MKRSRTLDICRGLLFAMMANTHALSLAGVPHTHWLFADYWLPNGWATAAFVVLSGYGIGWIFSATYDEPERSRLLRRRSAIVLAVMFASNAFFAAVKSVLLGHGAQTLTSQWWLGFFTLDTEWTISGVLLPTALVLLCGSAVIRWIRDAPWQTLLAIVLGHLAASMFAEQLATSDAARSWPVRFFLLEGFGGYPVLPFMANGFMGIWLGVQRHRDKQLWLNIVVVLMGLQLAAYLSTLEPHGQAWSLFRANVGAFGKFAWVLFCASLLSRLPLAPLTLPVALIGKYALASFILHRVVMQALSLGISDLGFVQLPVELHFATLWLGTLATTWVACIFWQRRNLSMPTLQREQLFPRDDYRTRQASLQDLQPFASPQKHCIARLRRFMALR
ncbi:acyltransferase family protein [Rhodoferax ferrireducens]